jgi:hypothetical protein
MMTKASEVVKQLEKKLEKARTKQLYATFYSPGTLFPESSSFEVETQDIEWAVNKAKEIKERHNAKPHSFRFEDGNRKPLSGFYFLTGSLKTYDDIPDDDDHHILRSNMLSGETAICIENCNSFRFTGNFRKEDVILDWEGNITRRGNDPDLMEYREKFKQIVKDYYDELDRKYGK